MPHAHDIYAIRDLRRQEYLVEAERERLVDQYYPSSPARKGETPHCLGQALRRAAVVACTVRFILRPDYRV
jgi:hypothetical protein